MPDIFAFVCAGIYGKLKGQEFIQEGEPQLFAYGVCILIAQPFRLFQLSFPSAVRPDMRNHRPAQPSSLEFWRDSNIFQFINLRSFPRDEGVTLRDMVYWVKQ